VLAWTALLAAIHIAMGIVWLAFYAWLVARVRGVAGRPRVRRSLDRVTGCVLVGLGLRVAAGSR
jgi:threonine/homoserine/homoserine lactone efflux protein